MPNLRVAYSIFSTISPGSVVSVVHVYRAERTVRNMPMVIHGVPRESAPDDIPDPAVVDFDHCFDGHVSGLYSVLLVMTIGVSRMRGSVPRKEVRGLRGTRKLRCSAETTVLRVVDACKTLIYDCRRARDCNQSLARCHLSAKRKRRCLDYQRQTTDTGSRLKLVHYLLATFDTLLLVVSPPAIYVRSITLPEQIRIFCSQFCELVQDHSKLTSWKICLRRHLVS